MNNCTPATQAIYKKQANSYKHTNYQSDSEETKILKRSISSKEIESLDKKSPNKRSPRQHGFIGKFYQTFRGKLTAILFKLFQNLEEQISLPKHSMRPVLPQCQSRTKIPQETIGQYPL